jgi:hypothetical protein
MRGVEGGDQLVLVMEEPNKFWLMFCKVDASPAKLTEVAVNMRPGA